jgi:hypothetical protein
VLVGPRVELGHCVRRATARLAPAAAANASLLPSEVVKNLMVNLRRVAHAQFPICYPEIKLGNPLSSALITHYSSLENLPYPTPPAISQDIRRATRRAIREIAPQATRQGIRRTTWTAIRSATRRAIRRRTRQATWRTAGTAALRAAPPIVRRIAEEVIRRAICRAIRRIIPPAIRRAIGQTARPGTWRTPSPD